MPHPPRGRFFARLSRFFAGRYGADHLYYFLFAESLVCYIFAAVFSSLPLYGVSLAILLYALWRTLSRNLWKRRKENERFLRFFRAVRAPFKRLSARVRYRKTHVFRRCPSCKNHLRLPRVKGFHTVRCPKCNIRFETKI